MDTETYLPRYRKNGKVGTGRDGKKYLKRYLKRYLKYHLNRGRNTYLPTYLLKVISLLIQVGR
jgi:hypothetical protein